MQVLIEKCSPALASALREIDARFGIASVHRGNKNEVRRALHGLTHELRLKHKHIIERARKENWSLETAIASVTLAYRLERNKLAKMQADPLTPEYFQREPRGLIAWYRQILLTLRTMRRLGLHQEFAAQVHGDVAAPLAPVMSQADRVRA